MKTFQIRFVDSKGSGSFKYVDVEGASYEDEVVDVANEYLNESRESTRFRMSSFTPIKTVTVVEYNRNTHRTVPKGIKFKLRLAHTEYTFHGGRKVKDDWYELKS